MCTVPIGLFVDFHGFEDKRQAGRRHDAVELGLGLAVILGLPVRTLVAVENIFHPSGSLTLSKSTQRARTSRSGFKFIGLRS